MDVDEGFILGVYNYCDRWCEKCRFPSDTGAGFIRELEWLRHRLETEIPRARAFVRPAFDEPDEVRRLEITDWA
jgi:hypothetical protein